MESTPLHFNKDSRRDSSDIGWPTQQNGTRSRSTRPTYCEPSSSDSDSGSSTSIDLVAACNFPDGSKSLSGIAVRAFLLGVALGVSLILTVQLLLQKSYWRPPFFLTFLSLFHFLEYYLTARYNTPSANVNAFLLSRNGRAYNAAHTGALLECVVTAYLFPSWQQYLSNSYTIALGFTMMIVGQLTRSAAMAKAGTNFNHTVQTRRIEDHVLVTTGIYTSFRHPSYFGFFWWGLGTQLVLGNLFCFLAYTCILWRFFKGRIHKEEELLVEFFGKEYEDYRARTRVWIPFIK